MFCYHCQEAKKNNACDTTGICGKKAPLSSLQDLLIYTLKGLSFYVIKAKAANIQALRCDQLVTAALYATVTNVNFDSTQFVRFISESIQRRNALARQLPPIDALPEEATWQYARIDEAEFILKGESVSVPSLSQDNAGYHGLRESLVYAVKGLASIVYQAFTLGHEEAKFYDFIHQALYFSIEEHRIEEALTLNLHCGKLGLEAMTLLNQANTQRFGEPTPTQVHTEVWDKAGILISGHNLQDIQAVLEQTAKTDIDVYTHGEALIAHAYPAFKRFFNLAGHYGGAWQEQKQQFAKFNGALLVTTNSLQQAKKTYLQKLFTSGMVGWEAIPHIDEKKPNSAKNFSALIEQAKQNPPPTFLAEKTLSTGYGLTSLNALMDTFTEAIQAKKLQRIIVIAGCDGRHKERRYYTELVEKLPQSCLVLTCGEAKYRFNHLDLGDINGIPRLLDVGQSSDFSIIILFLKNLQQRLNIKDLTTLPVSFNIAWYEQQTIVMFLSLLELGFKNVRLGPTLPPFFKAEILKLFDEKFALKGIGSVEADIEAMLKGE
jgi:hydroxylamine reductase